MKRITFLEEREKTKKRNMRRIIIYHTSECIISLLTIITIAHSCNKPRVHETCWTRDTVANKKMQ